MGNKKKIGLMEVVRYPLASLPEDISNMSVSDMFKNCIFDNAHMGYFFRIMSNKNDTDGKNIVGWYCINLKTSQITDVGIDKKYAKEHNVDLNYLLVDMYIEMMESGGISHKIIHNKETDEVYIIVESDNNREYSITIDLGDE